MYDSWHMGDHAKLNMTRYSPAGMRLGLAQNIPFWVVVLGSKSSFAALAASMTWVTYSKLAAIVAKAMCRAE